MKIYYINDETQPVTVRINHQMRPLETHFGEPKVDFISLKPGEAKVFEIDAPEGSIPYVKRWENRIVLLSYITLEALEKIQAT